MATLWYYQRFGLRLLAGLAQEALNLGVLHYRGRLGARLFEEVPISPSERWARRLRASGPEEPVLFRRLIARWKRVRTPVDSVQSRAANLPPTGLAGARGRRILVFHDADKAGPHLEAYIEYEGTAYNIGVKRLSPQLLEDLGVNRSKAWGEPSWLTQASAERLKDFWASEFALKETRWLAQSTDHRPHEARMGWGRREDGVVGYGAGELRQVLDDCEIVFHTTGKSVEFHDPLIDRHRKAFVFKSMPVTESRPSNILGVGLKENPARPDVPKLSMPFLKDAAKFQRRVGPEGLATVKMDGASALQEGSPKGTRSWSPRISKVTGASIMYDGKIGDWAGVRFPERTLFMGELMTYQPQPDWWFLAPGWAAWLQRADLLRWLRPLAPTKLTANAAHITGGYLNANRPLPPDVKLKLWIYLVARQGRQDLTQEPYAENYERVKQVAALHPDWEAVPLVRFEDIPTIADREEGVIGVPAGRSIAEGGLKLKLRGDGFDWQVDEVALQPGANGGIAGVVWFRSLESGRRFKIGGGPLGTMELRQDMLAHPEKYEGRVYEVACFGGHEGRAAHIVREHPDKGFGV